MNTTSQANTFLKRRSSRTVVGSTGGFNSSTSSSAASSVIMTTGSMPKMTTVSKKKKLHNSWLQIGFKYMGTFCASKPWEAIVTFGVTFLSLFFYFSRTEPSDPMPIPVQSELSEYLVFVYAGQILAVLHIIYRVRNTYLIRSSEILCIMLSYIISFLILFEYISLQETQTNSKDAIVQGVWPIVFLLIDIPRVTSLAHFVLCASHTSQLTRIMAKGMSILCPSFLIDTLASICVFGLFALTNEEQWVRVAKMAFVFNILNFGIYISVYPAILKLYFELTHSREAGKSRQMVEKLRRVVETDDSSMSVTRVKVVGMFTLAIFHMLKFWPAQSLFIYYISQALFLAVLAWLSYSILHPDAQVETRESLQSLYTFLNKQLDDIDVDTDDNCEEETSSSRSDEAMLSSTDEGIGTCSDKKPVIKTSSGSTVKATGPTVRGGGEDSSSDWSDASLYKFNNAGVRCLSDVRDSDPIGSNSISKNPATSTVSKLQQKKPLVPLGNIELRPLDECRDILKLDPASLTDDEVIQLMEAKDIRVHALEKVLNDHLRGVEVRRKYLLKQKHMKHMKSLDDLPYLDYNYEVVMGACAESVIGVMTLPVGCVGPLLLDGKMYHVPMATTEGCLVASTNRGCSALTAAGGVTSQLYRDCMTRSPVLEFASCTKCVEAMQWIQDPTNFLRMKSTFETTSRFAKLIELQPTPCGNKLHIRFAATTGDAMGMNMLSKATEHTLKELHDESTFPEFQVISLSGNMCTDKKPSAMNWVRGRGKAVMCEATIPAAILEKTLKTSTEKLVKCNISKNYEGSALAGSIGGNNAHAANIVTAIYIATGQDVAQTIESSNCLTQMDATGPDGRDLRISVTMPSIEVGTVGGGTVLAAQGTCLDMLGVRGSNNVSPGSNAKQLARIIAGTVLAGELSLMSALTEGHLVKSHLRHNRSSATVASMSSITDSVSQSVRELQKRT